MDYLSLILLSIGLSLDDFALAFAISLLWPKSSIRTRLIYASRMALAFSISTSLLPLLGWLIGKSVFDWIESYGTWVVLIVFCGVGGWVIKEGLEDEPLEAERHKSTTFWGLMVMGVLSSIDEGIVGFGFHFIDVPLCWIIISILIVNTIIVFLAVVLSIWGIRINQQIAPLLSGVILILLGTINAFKI